MRHTSDTVALVVKLTRALDPEDRLGTSNALKTVLRHTRAAELL